MPLQRLHKTDLDEGTPNTTNRLECNLWSRQQKYSLTFFLPDRALIKSFKGFIDVVEVRGGFGVQTLNLPKGEMRLGF